MQYKYDADSDVLAVFLSKKPFDYAEQMGDIVVHFDKNDKPVYLEFLNASLFFKATSKILPRDVKQQFLA